MITIRGLGGVYSEVSARKMIATVQTIAGNDSSRR